jgi:hypothetical protein
MVFVPTNSRIKYLSKQNTEGVGVQWKARFLSGLVKNHRATKM